MISHASRSVVKAVKAVAQPEGVGATVRRSIGSAQLRNRTSLRALTLSRRQVLTTLPLAPLHSEPIPDA